MADIERLRELQLGEEVTVITKGQYQIVDVASSLKISPLTECTVKLTPFIENCLRQGSLALAGEEDAPKAQNKALSGDDLKYEDLSDPARLPREVEGNGSQELTSSDVEPRSARRRGKSEQNSEPSDLE